MLDGTRLAVTTLTAIRVPGPRRVDRAIAGRAMELAPLVGIGIGLLAAAVLYAFRVVEVGTALPSIMAVGALALITRGLHLDGLADVADGLGSGRDPEGTRAVMKAPDIGPFGVVTTALVLALQASALATCIGQGRGTASLVLSVAVGRLAVTAACRSTSAATSEGLGALVAGTVRRGVPALWFLLLMAGSASYALVDPDAHGLPKMAERRCVIAIVVAMLVTRLMRRRVVRRVGGLTGDVLGALCEIATTTCLVVLSFSTFSSVTPMHPR